MTKALKIVNIYIYIVWEKGQWEMGHFKMFQGRRDTLFSGKREVLPSGTNFILWELDHLSSVNRTTYPLGIGPLILWDSGHPLVNKTWEMGYAILWDSDHLSSGKHPPGIGNVGDEVQPKHCWKPNNFVI